LGGAYENNFLYEMEKIKGSPLSYWNFHLIRRLKELIKTIPGAYWQPKFERLCPIPLFPMK